MTIISSPSNYLHSGEQSSFIIIIQIDIFYREHFNSFPFFSYFSSFYYLDSFIVIGRKTGAALSFGKHRARRLSYGGLNCNL